VLSSAIKEGREVGSQGTRPGFARPHWPDRNRVLSVLADHLVRRRRAVLSMHKLHRRA
jgi:hypothetical protein